jgi:hypothetical protein
LLITRGVVVGRDAGGYGEQRIDHFERRMHAREERGEASLPERGPFVRKL